MKPRMVRLGLAVVAVGVALLVSPYVGDVVDALGVDEDQVDDTVATIVEWLFVLALAMLLYVCATAAVRFAARFRSR